MLAFGVRTTEPPTLLAIAVFVLKALLSASLTPSRRAIRIDPIEALRTE